ncbi:Uncharacterised protein [uncultured archaeon]|nr:Uncharacterised protein [uncultured archaeon]
MLVSASLWSKVNEIFTLEPVGGSLEGGNVKIGAVSTIVGAFTVHHHVVMEMSLELLSFTATTETFQNPTNALELGYEEEV